MRQGFVLFSVGYTEQVISRRAFLALPLAAACTRRNRSVYPGYAFVANEEGHAVAVVDLEALAVARHIPLGAAPVDVVAAQKVPLVYALTAENGTVHEIRADRLSYSRKLVVGARAAAVLLAADERAFYAAVREPRSLVRVSLDSFTTESRIALPDDPLEFALAAGGRFAAMRFPGSVRLVDLNTGRCGDPLGTGDYGPLRFLANGRTLIAADRGERRLSLYDVESARLITHLPLAVRPEYLCFNRDNGQLFVTGEGIDGVVIVYPYQTEVAETVLAGHEPGPMAASDSYLVLASPQSGHVSILEIRSRKVIAVVSVGHDPGFIAITPDDEFALVLNRQSGDVAVVRLGGMTANRRKPAALLTVIPVGSRPVSAAVRGV
jgi:DNA-binding beta-propeller fold protein YncE